MAAPILLTLLRLIQGFALGGEWGGAVLIVSEHGGERHRGFWASWPQAGAPGGNLLATGVLAFLAAVQSDAAFLSWGWRIPFLLSGVLVVIGLWVRMTVSESPVFLQAQAKAQEEAAGARSSPRSSRSCAPAGGKCSAPSGCASGRTSPTTSSPRSCSCTDRASGTVEGPALNAVLIGSAIHFATIPMWGALSDRIGRRAVTAIGAIGMAVWAFAFFALADTGSFALICARSPSACCSTAPCTGRRPPSSPNCSTRASATRARPSARSWRPSSPAHSRR